MIAYDVVVLLLPATLLGSTVGVFLNKLCPNWLIMGLLVALCAYSGKRTLAQAFKRRERESREREQGEYASLAQSERAEAATEMATMGADAADSEGGDSDADGAGGKSDASRALRDELEREAAFPYGTMFVLLRTWLAVMGLSLLKGGHGAPSLLGVKCGSLGYWGVVGLNFPVLGLLTAIAATALIRAHARKQSIGYTYVEGDVEWDGHKLRQYPMIIACGSVAAGMLGVGGGMILNPIFNELSFLPQVSSATSTIMVLFMSSANVGQFIVFGMLEAGYAVFYGLVGVVGAIVGTKGAKALIERTGRASFLLFFLAAILLGSGLLMLATGTPQIMKTGLTGFRPLCGLAGAASRKAD